MPRIGVCKLNIITTIDVRYTRCARSDEGDYPSCDREGGVIRLGLGHGDLNLSQYIRTYLFDLISYIESKSC